MLRKLSLAAVAAVSLGAAALAPSSASAWGGGFHGGWHGGGPGWHAGWYHRPYGGFYGPRFYVGGPAYYAGGYGQDLYVAFLNSTGSALLGYYNWVVPGDDCGYALARDHLGGVYVAGSTSATNFLVTPGVLQHSPGGGGDAFVMKIAP